MDTVMVIMLKDMQTGFLDKELAAISIEKNEDYIINLFAADDENGNRKLHIRLSTGRDVLDWEYEAIFDYYDIDRVSEIADDVFEIDDDYNPAWEVIITYTDDIDDIEGKVRLILDKHTSEMQDVYETIADKEEEYNGK